MKITSICPLSKPSKIARYLKQEIGGNWQPNYRPKRNWPHREAASYTAPTGHGILEAWFFHNKEADCPFWKVSFWAPKLGASNSTDFFCAEFGSCPREALLVLSDNIVDGANRMRKKALRLPFEDRERWEFCINLLKEEAAALVKASLSIQPLKSLG